MNRPVANVDSAILIARIERVARERMSFQAEPDDPVNVRGQTYLIMANEGDAREYAGYVEAVRLNNTGYLLDPIAFPAPASVKANAALGRLNVSTASGDVDGDGDFDRIEVPGARSVSIRDELGRLVWDSGEMFERLSELHDGTLTLFNTTNTANTRENRSDDKGVEPESVVVGRVKAVCMPSSAWNATAGSSCSICRRRHRRPS